MKSRHIILRILRLAAMSAISGIALPVLLLAQKDTTGLRIDSLIYLEKLSDRAMVVNMGYDAVTAIKTEKGIVVIDAGISTGLTKKFRERIEKEFGRKDFIYLVNTHAHPDHYGGNSVFADAVIVGPENSRAEIEKRQNNRDKVKLRLRKIADDYQKEMDTLDPRSEDWENAFCQKYRYYSAFLDVSEGHEVPVPMVNVRDSLDISLGNATLKLFCFGKAHSGSDLLTFIPELKLLMSGDLFFSGGRLSVEEVSKQDMERWKKGVEWLRIHLGEIEVVVSGHGQVMPRKDLEAFMGSIQKRMRNSE